MDDEELNAIIREKNEESYEGTEISHSFEKIRKFLGFGDDDHSFTLPDGFDHTFYFKNKNHEGIITQPYQIFDWQIDGLMYFRKEFNLKYYTGCLYKSIHYPIDCICIVFYKELENDDEM